MARSSSATTCGTSTAGVLTHPHPEAGTYADNQSLAAADTLRLPTAGDGVVEVTVGDLLPE